MRKTISALIPSLIIIFSSCKTAVTFTTSEKNAQIFVDGRQMGSGQTTVVKVKKDNCVNVKVEKTGFLTENISYCYNGITLGQPKTRYIELTNDDAYDASILTDYANKDFEVNVSKIFKEDEAWKVISQIVTSYFDNLEMADIITGYMKTSWQSKSFTRQTIRTKIIVKQSSSSPLKYKIKIISEFAENPNQSVKNDDRFKEWDRVLRAYDGLITEFQSRLSVK
jgi:hypothetical protein|tara:strand:+ start:79 stop:750 length:672 start_codon:yes stop_codon:yes gene_type:complete